MADENCVKKTVKTRSMEEILKDDNSKRRRINSGELSVTSESNSDTILYCQRSRNVKDGFKLLDLKGDFSQADESMLNNGGFRREKTPSSVLYRSSGELMESAKTPSKRSPSIDSSDRKSSPVKMPSAVDLEEFFSEAEKYEAKRFAEKYNYDIVKDMPLKGRYEWIPVKP